MALTPIIEAVQDAMRLCNEVQHHFLQANEKFTTDRKDPEPVTIADYGAQALIGYALSQHFPDDAVIAEENATAFQELITGDQQAHILNLLTHTLDRNVSFQDIITWLDYGQNKQARRTWVIDPIDGTKGFVEKRHYVVAVGLVVDGLIQEGVMGCPSYGLSPEGHIASPYPQGAIFYTDGGRAYKRIIGEDKATLCHPSQRQDPNDYFIIESYEHQHASKSRMAQIRLEVGLGNARIEPYDSMEKYCLVACGDADLYMRIPHKGSTRRHKSWDHAAGVAIAQAAGATVTDLDGRPLDFSQGIYLPNQGMIVSNGAFHQQLVQATSKILKEDQ
ncbi:3'(2'),5'-bisphosphate nucleotidase [Anaerolineales bacterium]